MQREGNHVRDDADAPAERAVILHLLDPAHDQHWLADKLAEAIEDEAIGPDAVAAALGRLAAAGLVYQDDDVWGATRAVAHLDWLGLIAV